MAREKRTRKRNLIESAKRRTGEFTPGVISNMIEGQKPEDVEGAIEALRKVSEAVRTTDKEPGSIPLQRAIERAATTGGAKKIALTAVSLETGTPEFLLDIWTEETGRTRTQIESALREAGRKLRLTLEAMRHPDNVLELLNGGLQTGFVFLPTRLMEDLYKIGEMAADALDHGRKPGPEMEQRAAKMLEGAAEWVRYCRKRWGIPRDAQLVPVRHLSEKEAEGAGPDEPSDPPF